MPLRVGVGLPVVAAPIAATIAAPFIGAMGTSVNYQGVAERATIEGLNTDRIEEMKYLSLDFVTEAGAWGDVAHTESAAGQAAHEGGTAAEETLDMATLEELQKQIEALTTSVTTLTESNGRLEKRAVAAEVKASVKELLAESLLPKVAQDRIAQEWDGKESVEGLADRIESEIKFIEEITGKKLEAASETQSAVERERERIRNRGVAPRRIVIGNGGASREGADAAPQYEKPKVGALAEGSSWLFGNKQGATRFEENFITG